MVVGDGREPFLKLLEHLEHGKGIIEDIPNIIYGKEGKLVNTKFVHYLLEDIPVPDFTDYVLEPYRNPLNGELVLPYQVTRGCVYNCTFCIKHPDEETFETKSYNKVIEDLKEMRKKYNCKTFMFSGRNIGSSYQYLNGLMNCFLEENIGLKWHGHISVTHIDLPLLRKMRQSGCESLMYGIETGSDRILKMINKKQTSSQASELLRLTKEVGIKAMAYFMVGYPHEEENDVIDTINFIKENKAYIDFVCIRRLVIAYNNIMSRDPLRCGICNLRSSSLRFIFHFDEVNGLPWRKKYLQQEKIKRRIRDALKSKYVKLNT